MILTAIACHARDAAAAANQNAASSQMEEGIIRGINSKKAFFPTKASEEHPFFLLGSMWQKKTRKDNKMTTQRSR